MNQKSVAKEWLLLLALLALGAFIVLPSVVYTFGHPRGSILRIYGGDGLFGRDAEIGWAIVVAPYLLVQLGRSIAWAVRLVRG